VRQHNIFNQVVAAFKDSMERRTQGQVTVRLKHEPDVSHRSRRRRSLMVQCAISSAGQTYGKITTNLSATIPEIPQRSKISAKESPCPNNTLTFSA
jgi:hypothetical protein